MPNKHLQQRDEEKVNYQGKSALSEAISSEHMAKLTVVIFVHHVNGKAKETSGEMLTMTSHATGTT